ncbi:MAG: carboxypeptidase M32 [Treponemataceae bacterium]|nr:carboxypeptidase M32 [Treponemataceae bacterium]
MKNSTLDNLRFINEIVSKAEIYAHAANVLNYDMETICPPDGMEKEGEVISFLGNEAFKLLKQPDFIKAAEELYENRDELEETDRALVESFHRDYLRTKNITPEMNHEFSLTYNKAFINWSRAREKNDFSIFAPSLKEVRDVELKKISLHAAPDKVPYNNLLDEYERGMTTEKLDAVFDRCKERLIPFLRKLQTSSLSQGGPHSIRTDFLTKTVTNEQQKKMAEWLLNLLGFSFERGNFTTSEHPFTSSLAKDDVRVTTHYYPNLFLSSIYSIIHECGHALFELNLPEEDHQHHINDLKTLGQHESVSRFYENVIGRSRAFIKLIYPKVKEIFPEVMKDVSEKELYEAVNLVHPSLIRTEADEFTYTFHIIIRYEIEKAIVNDGLSVDELPALWKKKYEEYLGVKPQNDREGILQDVHWTSGFGYFSTYALGNMYNAMYYKRMRLELDIDQLILDGRFDVINSWMREFVWKKANRLAPADWIKDITDRDFTPDDFLDYLESKYSVLYGV